MEKAKCGREFGCGDGLGEEEGRRGRWRGRDYLLMKVDG